MIRSVTVGAAAGLHARAAARIARAAADLPVRVSVARSGRSPVPADSVLALLTLAATYGTELTLQADGPGAEAAVQQIAALIAAEPDRGHSEIAGGRRRG